LKIMGKVSDKIRELIDRQVADRRTVTAGALKLIFVSILPPMCCWNSPPRTNTTRRSRRRKPRAHSSPSRHTGAHFQTFAKYLAANTQERPELHVGRELRQVASLKGGGSTTELSAA
jgi:hypothetical protein